MGMGIKTWEWEKITAYCTYSKLCDSREFMGSERKSVLRKLYTLLLAKCCVCQHLQLPARDYLHRHPLIASPAGHHWGAVPVSFVSASKPLRPSKTIWSLVTALRSASCSVRFSVVTVTDYCKIYLSRWESNGTKCERQGRRRRTALWLSIG